MVRPQPLKPTCHHQHRLQSYAGLPGHCCAQLVMALRVNIHLADVEPPQVGLQPLLGDCDLLHEDVVLLELHQQLTQLCPVIPPDLNTA